MPQDLPSHSVPPKREALGKPSQPISIAEIQCSLDKQGVPAILSLQEAASLIKLRPSTLKRKVSQGAFRGCVSRGKPLRFWRDRLVHRVMNNSGN